MRTNTYKKDGITIHEYDGVPTGVEKGIVPMTRDEDEVIAWAKENGHDTLHKINQAAGMVMYKVEVE